MENKGIELPSFRGVRLVTMKVRNKEYQYWQISISIQGDIEKEFFSISKLGYENAYNEACKRRIFLEKEYGIGCNE